MKRFVQPNSRTFWIAALAVFVASLVTFLVVHRQNVLDPVQWWSPGSLAEGVALYFIFGWCLIPLPFALAAIITEVLWRRESLTPASSTNSPHKPSPDRARESWYAIACGGLIGCALGVTGAICWSFLDPYDFEQSKLAISASLPVVGFLEGSAFAFGVVRARRVVAIAGPLGWSLQAIVACTWALLAFIAIASVFFLVWFTSGPPIKWG